ncbi:MAG: sensor domain-containing phosphodiesterase [Clostridia bacterium]|nr:sensor domain-containing phosphodiesterase [Clostridia bacterium]
MKHKEYDSLIVGKENAISYIADYNTYELIHLTQKAMELFKMKSPEEYRGMKCYKLLQGLDAPCPFCTNDKLSLDSVYKWEHFNDVLHRWMAIEDMLVVIDGRLCRLEHAYDITDQRRQIKRLSDQLTVEQILVRSLNTLAASDDYSLAFNSFLEQLGRFYRADRAYIFEIDYDKRVVSNTYEWCAPYVTSEIDNLQGIPIKYISDWLKKFKETGEFYINKLDTDINHNREDYNILANQGIESLLAAPLLTGGRTVGFIGVDNPTNATNDMTLLRASSDFVVEELKKRRLIQKLERASYIDMLTGLNNRNRYMEVLKGYETNPPKSLGVVFADVNGMKTANDTRGHKYGDRLLIRVSEILSLAQNCHVYRIGGDEFVMLFENVDKETFDKKVIEIKGHFDQDPDCDVSIGSVWTQDEVDINRQIIKADELMYAEKQVYYRSVLSNGRTARLGISEEVAREIEENRFVVYYQPQINIKTNQIIGAEALVRKKGDNGEIIPPDRFIPYYEIEGVISHVDLFVFKEVCAAMKRWRNQGICLNICVNFSRVTLMMPDILNEITRICEEYEASPKNLTIEVTESIGKMDQAYIKNLFDALIDRGFTISLDDFGSKYSNLSILNDLKFHTVKIDKALVSRLENNEKSQIIMRNTIRMCHELAATQTLAEGIETEGQYRLLSNYKCEYGQGFFFSRPVAFDVFDDMIKRGGKE